MAESYDENVYFVLINNRITWIFCFCRLIKSLFKKSLKLPDINLPIYTIIN